MIYGTQPTVYTIAYTCDLDGGALLNAIGVANQIQQAFRFEVHSGCLPLNKSRNRFPNSYYNLEAAVDYWMNRYELPSSTLFFTSLPYVNDGRSKEVGYYFFRNFTYSNGSTVTLVSTYIWEEILGHQRLQPYILYSLAAAILSRAGLNYHPEPKGCLFYDCDDYEDINLTLEGRRICNSCEAILDVKIKRGEFSVQQLASVKKIYNRACGKKTCFLVMPFDRELKPVHRLISRQLEENHWSVIRADDIVFPRCILDAILQVTLMSDLVVADLTGGNPNVFYEVGLAHAAGCDVILLTQERRVPFDVTTESTIFYKKHKRGLRQLEKQLSRLAGSGIP